MSSLSQLFDPNLVVRDVDVETGEALRRWFALMSHQAGTATLVGFFEGIARDDDRALLPRIATPYW